MERKGRADYARIKDPNRQEHYVYRLYGKRGRLLYIGCSMNLKVRLAEQRRHGVYGHLIDAITIEGPFNYETGRRGWSARRSSLSRPSTTRSGPRGSSAASRCTDAGG